MFVSSTTCASRFGIGMIKFIELQSTFQSLYVTPSGVKNGHQTTPGGGLSGVGLPPIRTLCFPGCNSEGVGNISPMVFGGRLMLFTNSYAQEALPLIVTDDSPSSAQMFTASYRTVRPTQVRLDAPVSCSHALCRSSSLPPLHICIADI